MVAASYAEDFRIGVWNSELSYKGPGLLIDALLNKSEEFAAIDGHIASLDLDILLVVDVDRDDENWAASLLAERWGFSHFYVGPSNRGLPSGFDLNQDGRIEAEDRLGFADFRGQHSMVIFAKSPIENPISFNHLKLADFTSNPSDYYEAEAWKALPLSPTGLWDVKIAGAHILTAYASTPAFDGQEDRNGARNAAEIKFWQAYIEGESFIDDEGQKRNIARPFILAGTLNLDPDKGEGKREAIHKLLTSDAIHDPAPTGENGLSTANWRDRGIGALRVDYILPSHDFCAIDKGILFDEALGPHGIVWLELGKAGECE